MNTLTIEKKKYVVLPEKEYQSLQRKAALSTKPEKLLTIAEARAFSKKLIRTWAGEK